MSESPEGSPGRQLKMLQVNVMDVDSVLSNSAKHNLYEYFLSPTINKHFLVKNFNKPTQVIVNEILPEDLYHSTASEKYWELTAEKRRTALEEALEENKRLWKENEHLSSENINFRELLDEANSFVEVFSELVKNPDNDTGIDVGDESGEASSMTEEKN